MEPGNNLTDSDKPQDVVLNINYIEFPAADLDLAQQFYETVFGWRFTDYGPEYRAFNDEVLEGGFYKAQLSSSTSNGAALIVLYSKNLEATQNRVLAAGGKITRETFDFPGGRRFQFNDPNGNELAVWSDK